MSLSFEMNLIVWYCLFCYVITTLDLIGLTLKRDLVILDWIFLILSPLILPLALIRIAIKALNK